MPDRYVVRELEGYRQVLATNGFPGLSVIVLDSRWNYRVVREFKSEDDHDGSYHGHAPTRAQKRENVRAKGRELAARLNEATP
jgi:hypothetical protein